MGYVLIIYFYIFIHVDYHRTERDLTKGTVDISCPLVLHLVVLPFNSSMFIS